MGHVLQLSVPNGQFRAYVASFGPRMRVKSKANLFRCASVRAPVIAPCFIQMLTFALVDWLVVTYRSNPAGFHSSFVRIDDPTRQGGVLELMGVNLSINRLPL